MSEDIFKEVNHKDHVLQIEKRNELYTGTSYFYDRDWKHQSFDLDFLIRWFKSDIDRFSNDDGEELESNLYRFEMTEDLEELYEYF
jgi:hypothetical protein